MALTQDEVGKVANLARLELSDAELTRLAKHLNDLLARVEQMQAIDVEGIEPTSHSIPVFNVLRDDVVRPSLTPDEVLRNAPQARDGRFIVPRIIED